MPGVTMDRLELMKTLSIKTDSKIVLLVIDGLGGLHFEKGGKSELEVANIPNLDALAKESSCGLIDPVFPGITPGSGPAHLGLFGYDPVEFQIGRGVLEACGLGFQLEDGDVAARANFCTLEDGIVTDRRAGRIPTEKTQELCEKLATIQIPGVEIFILPGEGHRFAVVFRGKGLSPEIADCDPGKEGRPLPNAKALSEEAVDTAKIVDDFVAQALALLKDEPKANGMLLRGFASVPSIPSMSEVFKLSPVAIATYPMYRGLASLVGMEIADLGKSFREEMDCFKANYDSHDFFYIHIKPTDASGEDGNFDKKVAILEEFDTFMPEILEMGPDVIAVTGDHSTPAALKGHSWHPVPLMVSSKYTFKDAVERFTELECAKGYLGRIRSTDLMPILMANALKLQKFGA